MTPQSGSKAVASSGAGTKQCPFCAETIKADAKLCKHCHSVLDEELQRQQEARKWNPGVAAVLSLVIPGAGQMYRGKIGEGIVWLIIVVLGYVFLIIPGLLLHLCCIISAASRPQVRKDPLWARRLKNDAVLFIVIGLVVPVIARMELNISDPGLLMAVGSILVLVGVAIYIGTFLKQSQSAKAVQS